MAHSGQLLVPNRTMNQSNLKDSSCVNIANVAVDLQKKNLAKVPAFSSTFAWFQEAQVQIFRTPGHRLVLRTFCTQLNYEAINDGGSSLGAALQLTEAGRTYHRILYEPVLGGPDPQPPQVSRLSQIQRACMARQFYLIAGYERHISNLEGEHVT